MKIYKIQILKSRTGSGYFTGRIIEVDEESLEDIKKYNDVLILEEPEVKKKSKNK